MRLTPRKTALLLLTLALALAGCDDDGDSGDADTASGDLSSSASSGQFNGQPFALGSALVVANDRGASDGHVLVLYDGALSCPFSYATLGWPEGIYFYAELDTLEPSTDDIQVTGRLQEAGGYTDLGTTGQLRLDGVDVAVVSGRVDVTLGPDGHPEGTWLHTDFEATRCE